MSRHDKRDPSPESIFRLAERADLLDDPEIQKLVKTAAVTENTHLKRQIEKALAVKATQKQAQPFDDSSTSVPLIHDHVTIGTTITGSSYDLKQDNLTQHLLAVGQSGAGKTTLFYNLMDQLDVPF